MIPKILPMITSNASTAIPAMILRVFSSLFIHCLRFLHIFMGDPETAGHSPPPKTPVIAVRRSKFSHPKMHLYQDLLNSLVDPCDLRLKVFLQSSNTLAYLYIAVLVLQNK